MSDDYEVQKVDSWDEILKDQKLQEKRCLKELGSKAIEDAIKKTVCDLTSAEYDVDIATIDFEAASRKISYETVEIKLRLTKLTDRF